MKKIYLKSGLIKFLIFYTHIVLAQPTNCLSGCQVPKYSIFDSIEEFLDKLAWFIASVAFPIAGIALIWAGIKFLIARGDESQIREAKENLKWAIIGAFIALGAYVFVNTIKKVIETL